MSRTVSISTDVFAAIWAQRQEGEETEDAILRRILGCKPAEAPATEAVQSTGTGGVFDNRNNVHFPQGFRAFRVYKHREYEAIAEDGSWRRPDTGKRYPTLNQLNESIAAGNENIWNGNWKYRTDDGAVRSINELRR